jgi:OPT family oligopeptide transporter
MLVAAGAITGMRVCLSMLISGTLCWCVFVPILQQHGLIAMKGGFKDVVQWALWGGTSCMVASGILSFGLQWRSALRAFRSLGQMFSRNKSSRSEEMDAIETPASWFVIGQLVSLVALAILAHSSFDMPYWQSALAVLFSFGLALVACRVTGETDTTPIGAMGKVTQLIFGALNPGNINVNLMSANITASAAASSADLLTDLKSGYLLGANPRKQFIAQFAGIFAGSLITTAAFSALVNKPEDIGTAQLPAPAAMTWAAVARALSKGLDALEPVKVWSIGIGAGVGVVLTVLPILFPKKQKYFPSAAAVGLAWVFPWANSLMFFIGASIGEIFTKMSPKKSEEFTFPIASGVIAGNSLIGVLLMFLDKGPELYQRLFGH